MMSNIETGGPAFPTDGFKFSLEHGDHQSGMTLRDYFAAKVMQGFAADPNMAGTPVIEIANQAYAAADAMLKARKGGV